MKHRRLLMLVLLLMAVLLIRWWDPLAKFHNEPEVVTASDRHVVTFGVSTPEHTATAIAHEPQTTPRIWPVRDMSSGEVGNAFAVRHPVAALPPTPLPPKASVLAAFVGPVQPPPPPPEPAPPMQVIGTWKDGQASAVFLSSPNGTLIAHVGDVLLTEYKVQQISAQQVSLLRLSTNKIWTLPIPSAPPAPDTWSSH